MRNSRGWSVFGAIVAILAVVVVIAVLVPMFAYVDPISPKVTCMTNLHNIAIGFKMYEQDYKGFPESLAGYVEMDAGKAVHFRKSRGLYPEYIKVMKGFHCRLSPVERTDTVAEILVGGKVRRYYAYDSYDVYTPKESDGVVKLGTDALRYNPSLPGAKKAEDNTVITWCSYHREGGLPVLFYDGHSDICSAAAVEGNNGSVGSRWNTRPK
ncbi:MAG: hypothetical protein ABFD64_05760 [Armatimonadota bacterium]